MTAMQYKITAIETHRLTFIVEAGSVDEALGMFVTGLEPDSTQMIDAYIDKVEEEEGEDDAEEA